MCWLLQKALSKEIYIKQEKAMVKIKGRISQIIKKDELHSYMISSDIKPIDTKFLIIIQREDYPVGLKNFFKRRIYRFKNRKKDYLWILKSNKDFNVGEIIELNIKPVIIELIIYGGVGVFEEDDSIQA